MPRCVNATRVALIPKIENPSCPNDYRPISCCNVLYKCISKLIVHRLKTALADVIAPSQTAFLPCRQISDAILLTQELLHNYHLNNGPARCALKIDLKKAFDTVSWEFILAGLAAIAIPPAMITWITTCITTTHYSISINRESHGFFKASRGIRQGDPLSPYLFVLAMTGLGGIIQQTIQQSTFKYHWRCKPTGITHICFADDLMLFCHADPASIGVLKSSLDKFSMLSIWHWWYYANQHSTPNRNTATAPSSAVSWGASYLYTPNSHGLHSPFRENHFTDQTLDLLFAHICWSPPTYKSCPLLYLGVLIIHLHLVMLNHKDNWKDTFCILMDGYIFIYFGCKGGLDIRLLPCAGRWAGHQKACNMEQGCYIKAHLAFAHQHNFYMDNVGSRSLATQSFILAYQYF